MNTTTISSKYQIVLPQAVREKLSLNPGQKVYVEATEEGDILVRTGSKMNSLYGAMRKILHDADYHIDCLREEANRDRTR